MRFGLVQYAPAWEDPAASVERLQQLLGALEEALDVLVFPEMSLTGFTMESARFAEGLDGLGMRFFSDLAKRSCVNVVAGVIERDGEDIFNSLVLWDRNGDLQVRYRKIHAFSFASEHEFYTAGSEPVVARVDGERFGFSICYDLRFPELYRLQALRGATVMVDIANWPMSRIEHWQHLLKARAIENQCYMIGVNRVGSDPGNDYNGCSAVYDPLGGEVICVEGKEEIIVVDLEPERVGQVRGQMSFLDDIRLIKE